MTTRRVVISSVVLLVVLVAAAGAYATWPSATHVRPLDPPPVATCDYSSGHWMQQPGCDRPPPR